MPHSVEANPYSIRSHRLHFNGQPLPFLRSPNQSASFAPRGIILHDTAGRLDKGNAVGWFMRPDAKASAHLVIERDGSVTQQVGLDRRAWHAGQSSYQGESDVNAFAFGIELVNLGKCHKLRSGLLQPWFKAQYKDGTDGLQFAFANTSAHGKGWWLDYTSAQIRTVTSLCQLLIEKYDLSFIAGHWEIAPGRKIDPNPLFPMDMLRSSLFGESGKVGNGKMEQKAVLLVDANLRRWPSYQDNVIAILKKGTRPQIIRSGRYSPLGHPETWYLVDAAEQQGWVQGDLICLE